MAAAAAALSMGLDRDAVREGLRSFAGVPHRLEPVAEIGGVRYVNDSKATNVASATVGLRAFEGGVHAILGGSEKGETYAPLLEPVRERCAACYLTGASADRLAEELAPAVEARRRPAPLRRPRGRRAPRRGRRPARRGRPALARLRQLRRLRELRSAWGSLPRDRRGAAVSAFPIALGRFGKPAKGRAKKKAKKRSRAAAASTEYNMLLTATLCLLALGAVMVFSASSTTRVLQRRRPLRQRLLPEADADVRRRRPA